jgi:lipopolysaccharide/colanic/teichoic acid biosynthesis glycosyltransferase
MSRTEESHGPAREFQFVVKRVFDIITAVIALMLLSPLRLMVAIAIKIDSCGPILALQVRYCYDNRRIHALKFRCASVGTTGKADTVTRIGRLLSRRDIDRLPMLINVLRGDHSIVGPCSYVSPPLFSRELPAALQRSKLKPGLFCRSKLDSLNYSGPEGGTRQQIEDDLSYVTSWSLWLDVKIIVKALTSKNYYMIG